jgi:hypothetical protein
LVCKSAGLSVVGGEVHRAQLAKSGSKVAMAVFVNGVSGTTLRLAGVESLDFLAEHAVEMIVATCWQSGPAEHEIFRQETSA